MTDTPKTPSFDTVPVASLPKPLARERSEEDKAYAAALFAAIQDGATAAFEPTAHKDRNSAIKRSSQLKRLLADLAPTGKTIGSRVVETDDHTFKTGVFLADKIARKPRAKKAA